MTTKLGVYNKALGNIGQRKLASISENVEARRALDDWWDLDAFLEGGIWRFARRTAQLIYTPSIEPSFGYRRAFEHPSDFIRTAEMASDEYFTQPLRAYSSEAGFFFSDIDVLYIKYVSNDAQYGGDFALWTPAFENWVSWYLASKVCLRLNGDEKKSMMAIKMEDRMLKVARSRDSMEDPSTKPPHGTWARARSGRSGHRWSRGDQDSITG